jgi:large subunit ribosomal protein L14
MINVGTKLFVADNSGAKQVQCIRILGKRKKSAGMLGKIVVTVKKVTTTNKVKEGNIFHAIIVRTKTGIKRNDGFSLKFSDNSVVLVNKQGDLLGTRIFGLIPREIRRIHYCKKIVSLAPEII